MVLVRAPVELEDWLPPWCPTPPLSLGLVPENLAWEEGLSFSRVKTVTLLQPVRRSGRRLCYWSLFCFPHPGEQKLSPADPKQELVAGGGLGWGGSPWIFLPSPQLPLIFKATWASLSLGETAGTGLIPDLNLPA